MKSLFKNALTSLRGKNIKHTPPKIQRIPDHLKKYPNFKFNKTDIIHYTYVLKDKPDFTKIEELPLNLKFRKKRLPTHLKVAR